MSIKQRIKQYVDQAFAKPSPATEQPKAGAGTETPQASTEGLITQEIQDAITTAVAEAVSPLRTQLTKAQEDLATANKLAGEKDAEISRLQAEIKTANDKAATAEKASADLKADFDQKVAAGVAKVAASQGLGTPLPAQPSTHNPADPKATTPELKGLAKARAAIKAEITKK